MRALPHAACSPLAEVCSAPECASIVAGAEALARSAARRALVFRTESFCRWRLLLSHLMHGCLANQPMLTVVLGIVS